MMDCSEIQRFLHAYIDQEFDQRERLEFELHLTQCKGCREEVAYYRSLRKKLRHGTKRTMAPVHLEAAVRHALQAETQPLIGWFSFSFAAVGALACALVVFWTSTIEDIKPASPMRFAPRPMTVRTVIPPQPAPRRRASSSVAPLSVASNGAPADSLLRSIRQFQAQGTFTNAAEAQPVHFDQGLLRCIDANKSRIYNGGWFDPGPPIAKWNVTKQVHDNLCDPPQQNPLSQRNALVPVSYRP